MFIGTVRNIDNVFAKLQKKYVVFRPVTPISSVGPITAMIGLKEGLEPGDKFEILKSTKDPKTGKISYVAFASAKVDKDFPIFDNLYITIFKIMQIVFRSHCGQLRHPNHVCYP